MGKQEGQTVGATETSVVVLDAIADLGGEARTSELSDELPIAISTVYKHLRTLENLGLVAKRDDRYRIGSKCLELGGYVRRHDDIYATANEDVRAVANETGELANLMVRENGMGVYVYTARGDDAVNLDTGLGKRVPLNCTALGKAILSTMSNDEVDAYVDEYGLPERTPRTITDRGELFEELEQVRSDGVAYENGQRVEGICCVAAPISAEGKRRAAISITGPERRLSEDRLRNELTEAVQRVANVVEINLTYN